MAGGVLRGFSLEGQSSGDLAIGESGDRTNAGGVLLTMMTICLRKGLKTTHPTHRVFDHTAPPRKSGIIVNIRLGTRFAAGFAAGAAATTQITYPHIP